MSNDKYMAIPPGAIVPGALPDYKIYVRTREGKYILWALEGNKVSPEQLVKLAEGGLKEVFVNVEDTFKYELYLETHLSHILESQWSTDDQKATIFSKVSANVVKTAFEESLGMGTMGADTTYRIQKMVKNSLVFIMESNSLHPLAKMIGHDYQTYEHATKVLWFTVAFLRYHPDILKQIKPGYEEFDNEQVMEMLGHCGIGALLHDIGKAFVSQDILNKTGPLTEIEWEIMKRHPLNGLAMLLDTGLPDFVKRAVLQHHEDYCGGGYPMNIEGRNISILARLLRIADAFDAMTSRRPYKEPIPPGKAVQIMIGMPPENAEGSPGESDTRDQGMKRCFDENLLRKFIVFLGSVDLNK